MAKTFHSDDIRLKNAKKIKSNRIFKNAQLHQKEKQKQQEKERQKWKGRHEDIAVDED